jgi:hypothetical protein
VGDEPDVFTLAKLSLKGLQYKGCRVELLHAATGRDTVRTMRMNPDIALILLDVGYGDELRPGNPAPGSDDIRAEAEVAAVTAKVRRPEPVNGHMEPLQVHSELVNWR